MSEHTKGLLIIRRFGSSHGGAAYVMDSIPDDPNGRCIAGIVVTPNTNPNQEADKARIVALWNAFIDIPTEKLVEFTTAESRLREAAGEVVALRQEMKSGRNMQVNELADRFDAAINSLKAAMEEPSK